MEELWRENNIFYNILCFVITENEKLFDRSDANLYWRTVFHVFGIAHHAYIAMFANSLQIMNHDHPDIRCLYTFRAAYLTGWNFIFQTIFLGLSLSHDVLEWIDKQDTVLGTKIRYWKNVLFNGVVVPFTLFVTGMFWSIYAIDRELVFPKIYDEVVPWWFNQCVHTNITIMIIIETLLQARRYPTDEKMETILHSIVTFSYAIVYYLIYYFTRRWLYQVFGIMTWWQVCLFQLLIWFSCYFFYRINFPINRLIHGSEDAIEETAKVEVEKENGSVTSEGVNSISGNNVNGKHENGNHVNGSHLNVNHANGNNANGNHVNDTNSINKSNGINSTSDINVTNGIDDDNNRKIITDLKTHPFSTKSWSVKYRSVRNQFEKDNL